MSPVQLSRTGRAMALGATVAACLYASWACVSEDSAPQVARVIEIDAGTPALPDGAIVCAGGKVACGDTCADLQSDSANCGKCGRACGGTDAKCTDGKCAAVLLASGAQYKFGHGVDVDATNVYFSIENFDPQPISRVAYVPKKGGPVVEIAPMENTSPYVAVWNNRLYWTQWNSHTIRSVSITPGNVPQDLYQGSGASLFQIRATADGLFWTQNQASAGVYHRAWDAGADAAAVPLGSGILSSATGLWVDGTQAYFTLQNAMPNGAVGAANIDGSGSRLIIPSGLETPYGITGDANYVYITEFGGGTVKRKRKDGSGDIELLAKDLVGPRGLVVENDALYVVEHATVGRVLRISAAPKADGTLQEPVILADGQNRMTDLAQDSEFLYWITESGNVLKVRK